MLTHIVVWKYKPETTEEQRELHRSRLRDLRNAIREIVTFHVGADMLFLPRSYDTGLVATFKNQADLDVYDKHPLHQEVAAIGREIAAHVASVDFIEE